MNVAVDFKNVDIVFGPDTADALDMVDRAPRATRSSKRPATCSAAPAPT